MVRGVACWLAAYINSSQDNPVNVDGLSLIITSLVPADGVRPKSLTLVRFVGAVYDLAQIRPAAGLDRDAE